MAIKLRPEVSEALRQYNLEVNGRGMDVLGTVCDPEVIARLEALAMPNEDLNDTILRLLQAAHYQMGARVIRES